MKKTLSIICLVALAFCLAGPYPFFSLCQLELKREMGKFLKQNSLKKNLSQVEFKTISGKAQIGFELLDEGKEIRFAGSMYDVVRTQTIENETIYFCIKDKAETNLLSEMREQLIKTISNSPFSQEMATLLSHIFSQNYLPVESFAFSKSSESLNIKSFFYKEISSLFYPEKTSPPPEFAA